MKSGNEIWIDGRRFVNTFVGNLPALYFEHLNYHRKFKSSELFSSLFYYNFYKSSYNAFWTGYNGGKRYCRRLVLKNIKKDNF